jgi:hypothetical protein
VGMHRSQCEQTHIGLLAQCTRGRPTTGTDFQRRELCNALHTNWFARGRCSLHQEGQP